MIRSLLAKCENRVGVQGAGMWVSRGVAGCEIKYVQQAGPVILQRASACYIFRHCSSFAGSVNVKPSNSAVTHTPCKASTFPTAACVTTHTPSSPALPSPPGFLLSCLFLSWLYAYYAYDYKWGLQAVRLPERLAYFERRWAFFAGGQPGGALLLSHG